MSKKKTPLLDELEKGPWPSFVTDMKRMGEKKVETEDLLHQLEFSYKEKIGHWKHGGIVGVMGYGGGVIGRYSDRPDLFPGVAQFHTIRVNMPSGWFYKTERLRALCDIWEKYGSGMTNFHGSTGDILLLGIKTENLQPCFDALSEAGWDLGGSGSALRTPSACIGQARCEWACYDTLGMCHDITMEFQDEIHRPMWPYKFKIKMAGCPNDCVASIARADLSLIGTWKGSIQVDQKEVSAYVAGKYKAEGGGHDGCSKFNIQKEVIELCPTRCMEWNGKRLKITNEDCTRCMHCINVMPRALLPGKKRGLTVLVGGKAPILQGALLSWVLVPFMEAKPPYTELKDLMSKIWDWWDDNGKMRERLGELIVRLGMRRFLRDIGLEPVPQMVKSPRMNPYIFFWPEELSSSLEKKKDIP